MASPRCLSKIALNGIFAEKHRNEYNLYDYSANDSFYSFIYHLNVCHIQVNRVGGIMISVTVWSAVNRSRFDQRSGQTQDYIKLSVF